MEKQDRLRLVLSGSVGPVQEKRATKGHEGRTPGDWTATSKRTGPEGPPPELKDAGSNLRGKRVTILIIKVKKERTTERGQVKNQLFPREGKKSKVGFIGKLKKTPGRPLVRGEKGT